MTKTYNLNENFRIAHFEFQPCIDPGTNCKAVRIIDWKTASPNDPISQGKAASFLQALVAKYGSEDDRIVVDWGLVKKQQEAEEQKNAKKEEPGIPTVL